LTKKDLPEPRGALNTDQMFNGVSFMLDPFATRTTGPIAAERMVNATMAVADGGIPKYSW
jgi:hypothetical protein